MALRPSRPQSRTDQLAARDQAQQDVFLREVDDALREDELLTAARRYGTAVGAAVVVALAALGGYLWWDGHRNAEADKAGETYTMALDQLEAGRLGGAQAALAPLPKEGSDGTRAAARLVQAGIAAEAGKPADAARLFAAVAADGDAPQPYRDLARLREIALRFDTMPPADAVAALKPLAEPGQPWFGSAGELLGAAYLKQNKPELAGPLFAAIAKDPATPATLRSRARQLAGLLGVDAVVDVDAEVRRVTASAPPAAAPQ